MGRLRPSVACALVAGLVGALLGTAAAEPSAAPSVGAPASGHTETPAVRLKPLEKAPDTAVWFASLPVGADVAIAVMPEKDDDARDVAVKRIGTAPFVKAIQPGSYVVEYTFQHGPSAKYLKEIIDPPRKKASEGLSLGRPLLADLGARWLSVTGFHGSGQPPKASVRHYLKKEQGVQALSVSILRATDTTADEMKNLATGPERFAVSDDAIDSLLLEVESNPGVRKSLAHVFRRLGKACLPGKAMCVETDTKGSLSIGMRVGN